MTLMQTIQRSNGEAGAGALEMAEARYMIRVAGYLHGRRGPAQCAHVAPGRDDVRCRDGASDATSGRRGARWTRPRTVYRLGDIADVRLGPQMREGIAELDGQGEVVGGIVLMRPGGNALSTIAAVKEQAGRASERACRRGSRWCRSMTAPGSSTAPSTP